MSDINGVSITLATIEELIDELERRSRVISLVLIRSDEPNSSHVYRRIKWKNTTHFEAIGVLTTQTAFMNGLINDVHNSMMNSPPRPPGG